MTTPSQPATPAAAFCQNCGRPLTESEVRNVHGRVFCEPCIAAGMNVPAAGPGYAAGSGAGYAAGSGAGYAAGSGAGYAAGSGAGYAAGGYVPDPATGYPALPHAPSPLIAGLLGTIPGVGAMYNGQFAKGLIHVVIFIALISAANHFGPFGILIAAWFFYQIFDAVQTANAIRMGLPLPDPLGLNNIATRLGLGHGLYTGARPPYPPPPVNPVPPEAAAAPVTSVSLVPSPGVFDPGAPIGGADAGTAPPPPGVYPAPVPPRKTLPVGAVVLIALGALFLLNTFDLIDLDRIGKGWPLLLIGGGAWLLYRNTRTTPGGVQ